jgi:nucleoside-diphosphate-sugar epimerase
MLENRLLFSASYGMSGQEQLPSEWQRVEAVNVTGISNVIEACSSSASSVKSLVYTSTFNVVFGDQEIISGDESLPYFPIHRYWDMYSATKNIAERLVLTANGKNGKQIQIFIQLGRI